MKISIIGFGIVGNALLNLLLQNKHIKSVICYDKYKQIGSLKNCLLSDFCFLALPTPLSNNNIFDIQSIRETLDFLQKNKYEGICIIKSTILPNTTDILSKDFPSLCICHNPEFLSSKTANTDILYPPQIIIGFPDLFPVQKKNCHKFFYTFIS